MSQPDPRARRNSWFFRIPCHVTERDVEALAELLKQAGACDAQARHERGQEERVTLDYLLRDGRWARLYGFDLVVEGKIAVRVRDWPWNEVEVAWSPEAHSIAAEVQEQVRRWSAPQQFLCHFGLFVWLPTVAVFVVHWMQRRETQATAARERLAAIIAEMTSKVGWTAQQAESALKESQVLLEKSLSGHTVVWGTVVFLVGPAVGFLLARIGVFQRITELLFLWWHRLFPAVYLDFPSARHTQWASSARWTAVGLWVTAMTWLVTRLA